MRYISVAAAGTCILWFSACGSPDRSSDAAANGDSIAAAVTEDSSNRDSAELIQPPIARARLALDGEGLRLVNSESGATLAISYGTPAAGVIDAVTARLGAPTDRGTNSECGAGPVDFITFPGGLQLVVQKNQFVGWTARANGDQPLRTMSNVGLGSTRAELESAYAATITRSTIGVEFMAGGLQGVLESEAPTARITDLWSGVSCVMR